MKKHAKLILLYVLTALMLLPSFPLPAAAADVDAVVFAFDTKRNMLNNKTALYNYSSGNDHGKHEIVTEGEGAPYIKLLYEENELHAPYRCALIFRKKIDPSYRYVRVKYRTTDTLAAKINITLKTSSVNLVPNTALSGGEWALSMPVVISESILDHVSSQKDFILEYTGSSPDSDIRIKELTFFKSADDAYAYYGDAPVSSKIPYPVDITINSNAISKYKIVITSEDIPEVKSAARKLQVYINSLSGKILPIVTDDTEETAYEILVGISKREASYKYINELSEANGRTGSYTIELTGPTLVISSALPQTLGTAIDTFLYSYMYKDAAQVPKTIALSGDIKEAACEDVIFCLDKYENPENVEDPIYISEDFDTDTGLFTEDNGGDSWKYENGRYNVTAEKNTVSYIHVYESNVYQFATLRADNVKAETDMGLICRYVAEDAYVKAGYDFSRGEWYIDYREGTDLFLIRAAKSSADLTPGRDYRLTLISNGKDIALVVDGKWILSAKVPHITPGRVGVYVENAELSVDNMKVYLMSGEGTVLYNVEHTVLPGDTYREGGTVIEKKNGELIYQHKKTVAYLSTDKGKSWNKTSLFIEDAPEYLQILRLTDGSLICIVHKTVNGTKYYISKTSDDDGKTWTEGGIVAPVYHSELGIGSSNMNDKITQAATTGRIFSR